MFASFPSPSFSSIGPFTVYGILIALGVLAAVGLGQRRWVARGGHPDDISAIALWAVPAGVIGARLYHVITDWHRFSDEEWWRVFAIREGGLGIPGGMFLGVVTGLWVARRRGISLRAVLDAVVPALPLAQAIGRWGNYFNQELYGSETDLPWAVEIDEVHSITGSASTFHPAFLYESLWNFGLVGALIWIDKKGWLPSGRLISGYLIGYGVARLWLETIRVDAATEVAGLRVNIWMSLALIVGGLALALWPRSDDHDADADPQPEEASAEADSEV